MSADRIDLRPVDDDLRPAVMALAPRPEQAPFSGVAAQTLPDAERTPGRHPRRDPRATRFRSASASSTAAAAPRQRTGDLLLRAILRRRDRQGRGIGTAALRALPAYARAQDPDAARIVLTVNIVNPIAQAVYERAGFADTGELYHGGRSGRSGCSPRWRLAADQPSASL